MGFPVTNLPQVEHLNAKIGPPTSIGMLIYKYLGS